MNNISNQFLHPQKIEKIIFFQQHNNQIYINVTNLQNHNGFENFHQWLNANENANVELSCSIMHYDKFGFKNPEHYLGNFYINVDRELYVDFFITYLYVNDNDPSLIEEMIMILQKLNV